MSTQLIRKHVLGQTARSCGDQVVLPCSRHRKEDITLQPEMGEKLLVHSTIAEQRLLTLDAMRGVAALSVFLLHVSVYLGTNFAPGGDLAVDFFFALSGFVIAKAYSPRIRSGDLSFLGFVRTRIIRLYPLFFLGCMFGIVKIFFQIGLADEKAPTWLQFLGTLLSNLVMIPSPSSVFLFPLDNPAWSLFFELVANVLYVWALLGARRYRLWLLMLPSAIILFIGGYRHGDMGLGADWPTFIFGLSRAGYSFTLGALFFHVLGEPRRRASYWSIAVIMLLVSVFAMPMPGVDRRLFEPLMILFCLPIILWLGARLEIPARLRKIAGALGDVSYPLYAIHFPLTVMFGHLQSRLIHAPLLPTYTAFVAATVICAWLVARYYDGPVRAWLGGMLGPRRSTTTQIA